MKAQPGVRRYAAKTIKLLWGRAAGRCAMPNCRLNVVADETRCDAAVPIGDIAHVAPASAGGPRGDGHRNLDGNNDYDNLILLCPTCHRLLDRQANSYSIAQIRAIKKAHENWVKASLPERGRSSRRWRGIVLKGQHPVDTHTCAVALAPDVLRCGVTKLTLYPAAGWSKSIQTLEATVHRILSKADSYDERFAVFPLAPVSACIALGYFLTSRPAVRLFQYHRHGQTWQWPAASARVEPGATVDLGNKRRAAEISFLFELSATIDYDAIARQLPHTAVVRLLVERPTTHWLRSPRQLERLGTTAREMFEEALARWPQARKWHIFYAGPAPGAVLVGQQLNPTTSPPIQLYEFQQPTHHPSATLAPPRILRPTPESWAVLP